MREVILSTSFLQLFSYPVHVSCVFRDAISLIFSKRMHLKTWAEQLFICPNDINSPRWTEMLKSHSVFCFFLLPAEPSFEARAVEWSEIIRGAKRLVCVKMASSLIFLKMPSTFAKFRQMQSRLFTWHNGSKHSRRKKPDAFTQHDINHYLMFSMENSLSREIW